MCIHINFCPKKNVLKIVPQLIKELSLLYWGRVFLVDRNLYDAAIKSKLGHIYRAVKSDFSLGAKSKLSPAQILRMIEK